MKHYGPRLMDQEGFQCTADLLLKIGTMGAVMGEVDFILRYDLKKGSSKMKVGQTVFRTLRLLVQRRLGR